MPTTILNIKTIWKWTLTAGRNRIQMPRYAQVLTVQMQGGSPQLWASVNSRNDKVERVFDIIGTGHEGPEEPSCYIATFQMAEGMLVWHVFEYSTRDES